jgi:hypothetical protein
MTSEMLILLIIILGVVSFIGFLFYLLREYYRSLIDKMIYQTAKLVEKMDQLEERLKASGGTTDERRHKKTR